MYFFCESNKCIFILIDFHTSEKKTWNEKNVMNITSTYRRRHLLTFSHIFVYEKPFSPLLLAYSYQCHIVHCYSLLFKIFHTVQWSSAMFTTIQFDRESLRALGFYWNRIGHRFSTKENHFWIFPSLEIDCPWFSWRNRTGRRFLQRKISFDFSLVGNRLPFDFLKKPKWPSIFIK